MSSVGSLQQNCFEMSITQCQCISLIKQRHGVIKFVINKEKEFEFNFFFIHFQSLQLFSKNNCSRV